MSEHIVSPHAACWPAVHAASWPATGRSLYLLNQNLLLASQYEPGGWLYENHSRASTATRTNSSGLIESVAIDVPRLQHDSAGNPLGYLHEPQATNIATDSVDFSGYTSSVGSSGYQGTGSEGAMTPDYGTAPDGTDTATRVQLDLNGGSDAALGTNRSGIAVSIGSGITASSDHASSLYIKPLNGENLEDFVGYIGLIAGGAVDTPTDIEDVGDGWYRVFYASTPTGTTGTIRLQLVSSPGSTFDSLDCLIWGMQVELGSKPTSIIPTSGAAATRQADSAELDVPADSDGFAYVTYGDGGETTFAVTPGGTWTIPTDLDDTYARIIFKR